MIATPHLVGYTAQEDVVNESCWTHELAAKPAELCEAEGWIEGEDGWCNIVCNFGIKS